MDLFYVIRSVLPYYRTQRSSTWWVIYLISTPSHFTLGNDSPYLSIFLLPRYGLYSSYLSPRPHTHTYNRPPESKPRSRIETCSLPRRRRRRHSFVDRWLILRLIAPGPTTKVDPSGPDFPPGPRITSLCSTRTTRHQTTLKVLQVCILRSGGRLYSRQRRRVRK